MLLGLIANDDIYDRIKATGGGNGRISLTFAMPSPNHPAVRWHYRAGTLLLSSAVHKLSKQASTRRNPWRFLAASFFPPFFFSRHLPVESKLYLFDQGIAGHALPPDKLAQIVLK